MMKRSGFFGALAPVVMVLACEPGSVTEAREILGRNPGVASFRLPLADSTYRITGFLASTVDTVTKPSGVLGVRVQADTLTAFTYSDQLRTIEVTTSVGFPSPVFGAPGDGNDTLRFNTGQLSAVVGGLVQSGYVVRTITNNTGCAGSAGGSVRDSLGGTVAAFTTVNVPDGTSFVDSVSLAGATISGFADIGATGAITGACVPNPGGSVTSAITVRPLVLASVILSNVNESVAVEQSVTLDRSELNLDDFEDAVLDATLNDATFELTVINSADIPVVLSNFFIVAVRVDGAGNLMRDGLGNLIFETDATGARLQARIADAGQVTLTIARRSTVQLTVQAAAVVDRMVDLLIGNQNVAFVAIGDAAVGSAGISTITSADDVEVQFDVVLGMDFTVPPQGLMVERNQTSSGLGLDPARAADIAAHVVQAGVTGEVINSVPFGVVIELALAPGILAAGIDVFAQPGAVILAADTIRAGPANAQGFPTGPPAIDTLSVTILGADSRVVLGDDFTAGIRMRLLGGASSRGAIIATSAVTINASVLLEIRQGSGGGS